MADEPKKLPTFHFSIEADLSLDVQDIWPDGDAPANPTLEDVLAVIKKCGGARRILEDWNLIDDLGVSVSDGTRGMRVP